MPIITLEYNDSALTRMLLALQKLGFEVKKEWASLLFDVQQRHCFLEHPNAPYHCIYLSQITAYIKTIANIAMYQDLMQPVDICELTMEIRQYGLFYNPYEPHKNSETLLKAALNNTLFCEQALIEKIHSIPMFAKVLQA